MLARKINNTLVTVAKSLKRVYRYDILSGKFKSKEDIQPDTLFDEYKQYWDSNIDETYSRYQKPHRYNYLMLFKEGDMSIADETFFT